MNVFLSPSNSAQINNISKNNLHIPKGEDYMALPIQPEFRLTCPTERYIHRPKPPCVWLIQKSGTGYNRDSVVDPTDRNHQAYQGGPSLKLVLNINSRHTKPKYSVPFDVPTETLVSLQLSLNDNPRRILLFKTFTAIKPLGKNQLFFTQR